VFKPREGVDRVEMPKQAVFPVFLGLSSIEDRPPTSVLKQPTDRNVELKQQPAFGV
jgi:hypothetical protein